MNTETLASPVAQTLTSSTSTAKTMPPRFSMREFVLRYNFLAIFLLVVQATFSANF